MELDIPALMQQGQEYVMEYGLKVLAAIVIFFIGKWIAGIIATGIRNGLKAKSVDDTVNGFVYNMVYWALYIFVILAALGQLGIQTASFIAIMGAAGLAVGLALQGSLSNFAAGVLLVIFRPFKVGDYVEAGGASGIVEDIKIFSTQMRTPDNKTIILPNATIMNDNIVNYSTKPTRRVDLVIGVGYDAHLPDVKKILKEVVAADSRVLKEEDNQVEVLELGDSSVNFVVRSWTKTEDYWGVYFSLMENIKLKLDEQGINIPYPQMDVHLQQTS